MTRGRRIAVIVVGIALVVVGVPVALLGWTFSGMPPIEDGRILPGGARVVKDGYVSCFLVPEGNGRFLMVDACNDPAGTAIDAALTAAGAGRDAVDALLLTHGHPDHTALCAAFPNATVYALAAELPLLEGLTASRGPLPRLFGAMRSPCGPVTAVADGDTIPVGPLDVKVYAVAGHTAGSAAWRVSGVVYFGDAADAGTDGEIVPAKWLFTDDQAEGTRSLVALSARLDADQATVGALAFAHTGVLDGREALTRFAAAHAP